MLLHGLRRVGAVLAAVEFIGVWGAGRDLRTPQGSACVPFSRAGARRGCGIGTGTVRLDRWWRCGTRGVNPGFLIRGDDLEGEWVSVMSLVPYEPTGSSFLLPVSLPVMLTIPGPTQSHTIALYSYLH